MGHVFNPTCWVAMWLGTGKFQFNGMPYRDHAEALGWFQRHYPACDLRKVDDEDAWFPGCLLVDVVVPKEWGAPEWFCHVLTLEGALIGYILTNSPPFTRLRCLV